MLNNKKGLSTIIVTVLMIGLVIVAVGIVWAVVNGVLKKGAENIDWNSKCLGVTVEATAASCPTAATCSVTLSRTGTETTAITGVKLVFKDATNVAGTVIPKVGNISPTITYSALASGLTTPKRVEVTPYFADTLGAEHLCSTTGLNF